MSKAKTLKDVTDIKPREPHVEHPYDNSSRWNPKPIVLHIIDRQGQTTWIDMIGMIRPTQTNLTRCNRVAQYWELSSWVEVNTAIAQFGKNVDRKHEVEFKFCSRCGTPDDFIHAMQERDANEQKWRDIQKAEDEERRRLAEETWKRIVDAAFKNADMLRQAGIPTKPTKHDNERCYDTHIDGHDYHVTITLTDKKAKEDA